MDVARVTLAHGTTAEAVAVIRRLQEVVPHVAVMVDLPGPKIRTAPFPAGGVVLEPKHEVLLVSDGDAATSAADRIVVSYPSLIDGLEIGDPIALGDGGVSLMVTGRTAGGVVAEVRSGGHLQGRPGVTAPARRFRLTTPTPEDLERVDAWVEEPGWYVMTVPGGQRAGCRANRSAITSGSSASRPLGGGSTAGSPA